jgi:hypothetical protein
MCENKTPAYISKNHDFHLFNTNIWTGGYEINSTVTAAASNKLHSGKICFNRRF